MPTRTLETKQDCEDFVRGCTLLGTGGGGQPEPGVEALLKELDAGRKPGWVDASEIGDDEWSACPFLMGSIAPHTPEVEKEMATFGLTEKKVFDGMVQAIRELEAYHGTKVRVIVPVELGGANTPVPIATASQMGLKVIDGDYTGRAIPEIEEIAPLIFGKSLTPIASVDDYGDITIIKKTLNTAMTERLGKQISVAAYGLTSMAGIALSGKDTKDIVVKGTLTKCLELGRAIRQAREAGKDPVEAARAYLDGWILFKGKIVKKDWEDRAGYLWGTHTFEGIEEYAGKTFKIWFKNENHISWLNDKPYVTSPDTMAVVNLKTAEPKTNTKLAEGDVMAVLGVKSPEMYRTQKKGLEVLGPAHFGFNDITWKPIEEIVGK